MAKKKTRETKYKYYGTQKQIDSMERGFKKLEKLYERVGA